jgi:DNA invertase Pin-like site-specific DNA recombinase
MCYVRAYLRASTDEQDASRARDQLKAFAGERGLEIVAWYVENESGAKLARPELFRLLADAHAGDILLVEQVDRLSRLTASDWEALKAQMAAKHIRVVAIALPTSWMMAAKANDEFTGRMFEAINGMLLDMLAAVARKDYDDRRRRQAQGRRKQRPKASTMGIKRTWSAMPASGR